MRKRLAALDVGAYLGRGTSGGQHNGVGTFGEIEEEKKGFVLDSVVESADPAVGVCGVDQFLRVAQCEA